MANAVEIRDASVYATVSPGKGATASASGSKMLTIVPPEPCMTLSNT
jgi:hypothetical protein